MAFITVSGENRIAALAGNAQALTITRFVLANVPNLGAEPVNRIEAIPTAYIVYDHAPTAHGYVSPNAVVYSAVLDTSVGNFDFNWVGLVDSGGFLIACAHISTQTKRATTGGVTGNNLTRNFLLQFTGALALTGISIPAATWQIDFTARLDQIDSRERISNHLIFGTTFFHDAFKITHPSGYVAGAGEAIVRGIWIATATNQSISVPAIPSTVYLDVWMNGDITGKYGDYVIRTTGPTADYVDGAGAQHYVVQIATINGSGVVTDTRSQKLSFSGAANLVAELQNEINVRSAADNTLQGNINTEVTARTSVDTILGNYIDAEVTARQTAITNEANARNTAITNETNARINADNNLGTRIDGIGGSNAAKVQFPGGPGWQTGSVVSDGSGIISVTFGTAFASINSVLLTPINEPGCFGFVSTANTTGFTGKLKKADGSFADNHDCYWLAIGKF